MAWRGQVQIHPKTTLIFVGRDISKIAHFNTATTQQQQNNNNNNNNNKSLGLSKENNYETVCSYSISV